MRRTNELTSAGIVLLSQDDLSLFEILSLIENAKTSQRAEDPSSVGLSRAA